MRIWGHPVGRSVGREVTRVNRLAKTMLCTLLMLQTGLGWAVPTRQEAYRNDDLGVVVFRDSSDSEVYWYLPVLKPYAENGKIVSRKRQRENGNTDFTFYLVPQFPVELAEFVAGEIPGLHNRQQLKPVMAKRFGLQVKQYSVSALSDEVTDYRYLNQPQLVRLSLNSDDAADFEDLFSAAPGVPVNMAITYEAERVEKYLQIELSFKEVFDAMNIAASGRYTFTKGEIEAKVSNYLSNKYLTIKSKGDLKIPEIVEKVIAQCFTPAHVPVAPRASGGGRIDGFSAPIGALSGTPAGGATDAMRRNGETEAKLRQRGGSTAEEGTGGVGGGRSTRTPARGQDDEDEDDSDDFVSRPRPTGTPTVSGVGRGTAPSSTSGAANEGSLEFTFKRELATRTERFLYMQQQMADTQEISVIPAYLTEFPAQTASRMVTPLESRTARVLAEHDAAHPLHTGLFVRQGDQWTINAAFTLTARSPYGNGKLEYYRWDAAWPKTDGDLYYRVGNGPWIKVNARAMVGSDILQSGELQFYLDRSAIWSKLPAKYREPALLGTVPAIFPFNRTLPEFNVTLSGKRLEAR